MLPPAWTQSLRAALKANTERRGTRLALLLSPARACNSSGCASDGWRACERALAVASNAQAGQPVHYSRWHADRR